MSTFASAAKKRSKLQKEKYKPKKHHARGIRFLVSKPQGILAAAPGAGKTMMALTAFLSLRKKGIANRMLVVSTPKVIYLPWPKEIAKWGLDVSYAYAHGVKWQEAMHSDANIVFTTYGMLEKVCDEYLRLFKRGHKFGMLVLDECTKIKSGTTDRFKYLAPVLKLFDRRYGMTGNLIPHSYLDVWSQVYAVDLGASLGENYRVYRLQHFIPSGYMGKGWELANGEGEVIAKKIKHLVCRIGPEDLDEPPLHHVPRYVRLSDKVMAQYRAMEEEYILDLQRRGVVVASTAGAASMKLRQITGGCVYQSGEYEKRRKVIHLHNEKIDDLLELVEELNGEPLLVGYEFHGELAMLRKALPKAPVIGGGDMKENSRIEDLWNEGKLPVLLAQIDSISHGQNMQGHGCHVYIYTDTWNWENHFQFIKRVHRAGQKRAVTIHHAIAVETVDEVVYQASIDKEATQETFWKVLQEAYSAQQ